MSNKDLADACKDSKEIEVSEDGLKVRRMGNKALPAKTGTMKKRDTKAAEKKEDSKVEEVFDEPVQRDELGRIMFQTQDFENTLIIHFST